MAGMWILQSVIGNGIVRPDKTALREMEYKAEETATHITANTTSWKCLRVRQLSFSLTVYHLVFLTHEVFTTVSSPSTTCPPFCSLI
jgi:hypothetical protein